MYKSELELRADPHASVGQGDLLAVLILIGSAILIGIGFLSIMYPSVSSLVSQNDVRALLYNEQSLLVIYKEYENSTHVCTGILRLEPERVKYAMSLIVGNSVDVFSIPGVASFPPHGGPSIEFKNVSTRSVYLIVQGDYCQCLYGLNYVMVLYMPQEVIDGYIARGIPALLCLSKDIIKKCGTEATLYVYVQVGPDLYEVGRVRLIVGEE